MFDRPACRVLFVVDQNCHAVPIREVTMWVLRVHAYLVHVRSGNGGIYDRESLYSHLNLDDVVGHEVYSSTCCYFITSIL